MGKPLSVAFEEMERVIRYCRFYAKNGEKFLEPQYVEAEAEKAYIRFEPVGTVFCKYLLLS